LQMDLRLIKLLGSPLIFFPDIKPWLLAQFY
jgi:hypothetical protein